MKKQASVTGIAAAVLMAAGGILLSAHLSAVRGLPAIEQRSALPIELAFYLLVMVVVGRRYSLQGYLLGIGCMLGMRLLIDTAAVAWLLLQQHASAVVIADHVFSSTPVWVGSAVMAALSLSPLAGLLPERARADRRARLMAEVEQNRRQQTAPAASPVVEQVRPEPALYVPAGEQTPKAPVAPRHLDRRVMRQVEGWVEIPTQAIVAQLPESLLGKEAANGGVARVPLSVVLPELPEGRVRVRLTEVIDCLPEGCLRPDLGVFGSEAPEIDLPLEVIVPQLPEEVLEVEAARPPVWLKVDPELERTLFVSA